MKTSKAVYRIVAFRPNGEHLYFCSCDSQGQRMVPNGWSIAALYDRRKDAKAMMDKASQQWKGLRGWKVERWAFDAADDCGFRALDCLDPNLNV